MDVECGIVGPANFANRVVRARAQPIVLSASIEQDLIVVKEIPAQRTTRRAIVVPQDSGLGTDRVHQSPLLFDETRCPHCPASSRGLCENGYPLIS